MNKLYKFLVDIGEHSGCHRLPERSFFYKGYQFPVCARCTGAFVGYILGGITYIFFKLPVWVSVVLCAIMFLDWFLQKINIVESTNFRRLITGMLCGFGMMQLYITLILWIIGLIM